MFDFALGVGIISWAVVLLFRPRKHDRSWVRRRWRKFLDSEPPTDEIIANAILLFFLLLAVVGFVMLAMSGPSQ